MVKDRRKKRKKNRSYAALRLLLTEHALDVPSSTGKLAVADFVLIYIEFDFVSDCCCNDT
jgi:hypothetical protein